MRKNGWIFAIVLSGCSVLSTSDMPNLESVEEVKQTVRELDPIAPGSSSRDTGTYGLGQPGSDRFLFVEWVKRYADEDAVRRMRIDYEPAPIPTSIADAIDQQRRYEAARTARIKAEGDANRARQAAEEARLDAAERAQAEQAAANQAAYEARQAELDKRIAENAVKLKDCERASFEAQKNGALEDQAAIYQSFNCDQYR